nr:hypothetical protein [Liquorilactobacillus satsumensis]
MNNSQVFLAFALPFSMLPLLMMTDSRAEMGERFKNTLLIKTLGWISVIGLTYLNMTGGLPGQIQDFFGSNASKTEIALANDIAYFLIFCVLALLIWTVIDLYRGNKRFAAGKTAKP